MLYISMYNLAYHDFKGKKHPKLKLERSFECKYKEEKCELTLQLA